MMTIFGDIGWNVPTPFNSALEVSYVHDQSRYLLGQCCGIAELDRLSAIGHWYGGTWEVEKLWVYGCLLPRSRL